MTDAWLNRALRVPQRVGGLPPDFALFPVGYRDSVLPIVGPSPNRAKSAGQSDCPLAADTLGGRVVRRTATDERSIEGRRVPGGRIPAVVRKQRRAHCVRLRLNPLTRCHRLAHTLTAALRVMMKPFGFRTQPPLPRWLAPNRVCQWFPSGQPLDVPPAPVRRIHPSEIPTTPRIFDLAGSGG